MQNIPEIPFCYAVQNILLVVSHVIFKILQLFVQQTRRQLQ